MNDLAQLPRAVGDDEPRHDRINRLEAEDLANRNKITRIELLNASEITAMFNAKIEEIEAALIQQQDYRDLPVINHFADGVYFREGVIPAGHWGLGHSHIREELTIIFSGRALLGVDGKVTEICGPCVIKTGAGVRKLLLAIEDVHGGNIFANPTNETTVDRLEKLCIAKSEVRLKYEEGRSK